MSQFGRHLFAVWVVALACFSIGTNATAQKITTTFDKNFDFTNHKRYAWRENHIVTRQGKQNDKIINQTIVQEVNGNLAAKGFVEDSTNPDFLISCDAGASDLQTDVEGAMIVIPPGPIMLPDQYLPIPQNVWISVNGEITFHLIDARSRQAIWTTVATKKIRDPHKGMKEVDSQVKQFVSKSFKSFPPGKK